MQMEIRFASWTRAGKFRVTFVRRSNESHFRYRGGWAYIRIIQLQKCLARERDIYICIPEAQKNLLKKGKKSVHFPLENERKTFSPINIESSSNLSFCLSRKLLLLVKEGIKKSVPNDGEARNLR